MVLGPQDAWLVLRGLKTLHDRDEHVTFLDHEVQAMHLADRERIQRNFVKKYSFLPQVPGLLRPLVLQLTSLCPRRISLHCARTISAPKM